MYTKIDGTIYEVVTTKTVVDLDALKTELVELKATEEPTDEELIEFAKTIHPYYTEIGGMTDDLEVKISEIELAVKEVTK